MHLWGLKCGRDRLNGTSRHALRSEDSLLALLRPNLTGEITGFAVKFPEHSVAGILSISHAQRLRQRGLVSAREGFFLIDLERKNRSATPTAIDLERKNGSASPSAIDLERKNGSASPSAIDLERKNG